jgi:hypothetical protein
MHLVVHADPMIASSRPRFVLLSKPRVSSGISAELLMVLRFPWVSLCLPGDLWCRCLPVLNVGAVPVLSDVVAAWALPRHDMEAPLG